LLDEGQATDVLDAPPPQAPASAAARRSSPPALTIAVCAALAVLVAAVVYGRAAGYVYSEDSDFATEFGNHSWYHSLSFSQILGKYFELGHGWYRPTGFYLIPFLLRLDYFQPSEQIVLDIATLVVVSLMILLFVNRARVLVAAIAVLSILLAPSLYQVTYGAQADAFYIIFGLGFLWIADRVYYGDSTGWRRIGLWVALVVMFFATITTKEIGCLVAFLVIPFLLLRGPDQLTKQRVVRAVRFAIPFVIVVAAYGIIYKSNVNASSPNYSDHLSTERSLNFINMISWTLGFRSPRHTFENWVPNWSTGETAVQAVLLASVLAGLALTWRKFRLWRIGLFLLTALLTAVAIASVGGIPYHDFPLVIMYGFAILLVLEAAVDRVKAGLAPRRLALGTGIAGAAASILVLALAVQGHSTYGTVIVNGPQSYYLDASTELFYGGLLAPVRHAENPLFVFQDCLLGLDEPLKFYARSPTGTQLVVRGEFSYPAVQPAMEAAYKEHRLVYAALCTGTHDPWYVLRQYAGPKRGLVRASL
jgi:hypothetical protein